LKIWADAEVSEDPAIMEKLAKSRGHTPATHLAFLFHVRAFGWNYEKHIMQRSASEVRSTEPVQTGKQVPFTEDDGLNRSRDFQPDLPRTRYYKPQLDKQCAANISNEGTSIASFLAAQNPANAQWPKPP
jgi:hypothetical protein